MAEPENGIAPTLEIRMPGQRQADRFRPGAIGWIHADRDGDVQEFLGQPGATAVSMSRIVHPFRNGPLSIRFP
ncbi:hypothetical protein [Lysobacter sp. 1R34A]|uniref:hypothetical protein n=1 Tax=Lysobacter sp. 1R34A TaxID=3445786 RepID=UPI003EE83712